MASICVGARDVCSAKMWREIAAVTDRLLGRLAPRLIRPLPTRLPLPKHGSIKASTLGSRAGRPKKMQQTPSSRPTAESNLLFACCAVVPSGLSRAKDRSCQPQQDQWQHDSVGFVIEKDQFREIYGNVNSFADKGRPRHSVARVTRSLVPGGIRRLLKDDSIVAALDYLRKISYSF